jgi:hypothetical protein
MGPFIGLAVPEKPNAPTASAESIDATQRAASEGLP